MNNFVTPETALALQKAGFPQPTPEVGQIWYDDISRPVSVRVVFAGYVVFSVLNSLENMSADNDFVNNHCCYAPTATDILKELGRDYVLATANQDMFICKKGLPRIGQRGCRVNPAEAAAHEYLLRYEFLNTLEIPKPRTHEI